MNRLRQMREARGWSQLELARRARVAPQDISALETGKKYPFPGWRRRLAEALGVSEEEVFPEVRRAGGEARGAV